MSPFGKAQHGKTEVRKELGLLAQDAQEGGAILLAAVSGSELVGFSLALPALAASGDAEMFSCGLVVAPGHRRRGIGRSLKLEQRRRALDRGIRTIRWRADPLNAARPFRPHGRGGPPRIYPAFARRRPRRHGVMTWRLRLDGRQCTPKQNGWPAGLA